MGVKDIVTKDYAQDSIVVADAFNKHIYKGKQVIKPENLKPLDTGLTGIPYGSHGAGVPTQRYRDILKSVTAMEDENAIYLLLGVEAQSEVHHAMPVKNMVYDALQYAAQVEEAARSHKEARKAKESKEMEKKPNAGELSLHEMLSVQNPEILSYVSDYKLNLIALGRMTDEEIDQFQTSLREVMLFIKYSKDKAKLDEMVQKDERFRNMDRKAATVISTVTGVEIEENYEEDKVDMCQALKEMMEDATKEGAQEIARRMLKEGSFSLEIIAKMTELPLEEVKALVAELSC